VVTLSAMGALTMYILAMASLFRLRTIEPDLARPFVAPAYPFAPGFALVMAGVALVMLVWNNPQIAAIFAVVMVALVGGSLLFRQRGLRPAIA